MDRLVNEFAVLLCKSEGKDPFQSYLLNVGKQSSPEMERVYNWEKYVVLSKKYIALIKKAEENCNGN